MGTSIRASRSGKATSGKTGVKLAPQNPPAAGTRELSNFHEYISTTGIPRLMPLLFAHKVPKIAVYCI